MNEKFAHVWKHAVRVARDVNVNGGLVARSIVAIPLPTIASSTIGETWPFRSSTVLKLNWMSNFSVMSFRVKSLLSCSFFRFISPSARSFLWSTEVKALLSSEQICLCWRQASSVSYRQCCEIWSVICQTPMRSSTPTKMISRCRNFYIKNK